MFNPTRDQARRFFFDAWRCYRLGEPLEGAARTALEVMLLHPEYQPLLDDPERNLDRQWGPDSGEANPFLHLSLHLAIEEQLAIGQPFGLREVFEALITACGDDHEARHMLLECLGETLWRAQRQGGALDSESYLDCARRRAGLK